MNPRIRFGGLRGFVISGASGSRTAVVQLCAASFIRPNAMAVCST